MLHTRDHNVTNTFTDLPRQQDERQHGDAAQAEGEAQPPRQARLGGGPARAVRREAGGDRVAVRARQCDGGRQADDGEPADQHEVVDVEMVQLINHGAVHGVAGDEQRVLEGQQCCP